jgi:hypothetical protein
MATIIQKSLLSVILFENETSTTLVNANGIAKSVCENLIILPNVTILFQMDPIGARTFFILKEKYRRWIQKTMEYWDGGAMKGWSDRISDW